jgi:hypothetical protein
MFNQLSKENLQQYINQIKDKRILFRKLQQAFSTESIQDLFTLTEFLKYPGRIITYGEIPRIKERIFCYLNDIKTVPCSPVTKTKIFDLYPTVQLYNESLDDLNIYFPYDERQEISMLIPHIEDKNYSEKYVLEQIQKLETGKKKGVAKFVHKSVFMNWVKLYLYSKNIDYTQMTAKEAIFFIYNKRTSIPVCPVTGQKLKYRCSGEYNEYSSHQAADKSIERNQKLSNAIKAAHKERGTEIVQKRKQTCLEKYGVESHAASDDYKQKRTKTCQEKYGVDHYSQTEEYKQKIKQTSLERYGVEHLGQSKIIQQKRRETCQEKYGVSYPFQSSEIKRKTKETLKKKYGVEHTAHIPGIREQSQRTNLQKYGAPEVFQTQHFKAKRKLTNLDKYGVEHLLQSPVQQQKLKNILIEKYGIDNIRNIPGVDDKIRQTSLMKYGVTSAMNTPEHIASRKLKKNSETYDNFKRFKEAVPLFTKEEFEGEGSKMYKWKRKSTGEEFTAAFWGFEPVGDLSSTFIENLIIQYLKKHNIEFIKNTRRVITPLELDIFIPSKNLAIELHGIYFHNIRIITDKLYHQKKYLACKAKGIRLIQIFEDELINNSQLIYKRLDNILRISKHKIYARNCEIREISSFIKDKFLEKYHLQGTDKSSIRLGLFYKNRLVSVMTFGKMRPALGYKQKDGYELMRFASISNFQIVGGASKLFSYFCKNYPKKEITTYADLNWGDGNLYNILGFKFQGITKPGYFYSYSKKRFHRYSFRKSELAKKLKIFDPTLTERQNMLNNNFLQIYNSGNAKYVYTSN